MALSTYKLDPQNKIIYIKQKQKFLFCYKILNRTTKIKLKKASSHTRSACDEASPNITYMLLSLPI